MTPTEQLIDRLKALCSAFGVDTVAAKAEVSADNLTQILKGTKLPSGQPRGIGPNLARRLTAAYPGWNEATHETSTRRSDHDFSPVEIDLLLDFRALPDDEQDALRGQVKQAAVRYRKYVARELERQRKSDPTNGSSYAVSRVANELASVYQSNVVESDQLTVRSSAVDDESAPQPMTVRSRPIDLSKRDDRPTPRRGKRR